MTTPIDPGDTGALPPLHAKVLVTYWALDALLDWVMHHPDGSWNADTHYDQLRGEMQADVLPEDGVFVRRDDLRRALSIVERHTNEGTSPLTDRLRAAIGDE